MFPFGFWILITWSRWVHQHFYQKKSRSSWKRSKHVTFTLIWRFSYCQQVTTVLRWRMFWLESNREEIWSKRSKKCKLFWKEERALIMNHKEKKFNLFVWTFCYDIQGKKFNESQLDSTNISFSFRGGDIVDKVSHCLKSIFADWFLLSVYLTNLSRKIIQNLLNI